MRVPAICGQTFESMADYIRHLPRCMTCAAATMGRKP